jgi:hypothetical protein
MEKRVIYKDPESGDVCILFPVESCGLTVEEIAKKDIPKGVPFKIVDANEIPTDRTYRNAWEVDEFVPDGYGEAE